MAERDALIAAARAALATAYAPYSKFRVGAALRFADGAIVTGSNVENASYGLALCAETVAVAKAMAEGTPCGRCRQVLTELAELGGTDPVIWACGTDEVREFRLSELLPAAFGPGSLG